jgi:hypothetical protein
MPGVHRAMETPPSSPAPFLYSRLHALSADEYGGHGLLPANFGFARKTNSLPIGLGEFAAASWYCPIVFTAGATPLAAAMTGLFDGDNLRIDAQGRWQPSAAYVPGYLRRYPFWLQMRPNDPSSATMAVDADSPLLARCADDPRARPLFDEQGEPTALMRETMEMCRLAFQDQLRTQVFAQELARHDLLRDWQIAFDLPGSGRYTLRGFRVIDESAFRALPDEVLGAWVRNGWASAVTLHLVSMQNWSALQSLHVLRHREAEKAEKAERAATPESSAP